jgi:hypothetical protein
VRIIFIAAFLVAAALVSQADNRPLLESKEDHHMEILELERDECNRRRKLQRRSETKIIHLKNPQKKTL